MKKILSITFFLLFVNIIFAQSPPKKWTLLTQTGQYSASLIKPKFSPLHLGVGLGVGYHFNSNQTHKLLQSTYLNYFYHNNWQRATQLYTESSYEYTFLDKYKVTPFALGGGYVLSKSDLESFEWDEQEKEYKKVNSPIRHNWMISLGSSIAIKSGITINEQNLSFNMSYRFQVQGIVIEETVPVMPYSVLLLGMSLPL